MLLLAAITTLSLTACSAPSAETLAELAGMDKAAYNETQDAFDLAADPAEKVHLLEEFLAEFPDSRYANRFASKLLQLQGTELGEPEAAYDTVARVLDQTTDPERRFYISLNLRKTARQIGKPIDLRAVVSELEAEGPLAWFPREMVLRAAEDEGDWDLLAEQGEAAKAQETEEAKRAKAPDAEVPDEKKIKRANWRMGTILAYAGWAAVNQGRVDEGIAAFEESVEITPRHYLGAPENVAGLFWGRTLLQQGDLDGAEEVLAEPALFGANEKAMDVLREVHAAKYSGDDGFESYLSQARLANAKVVDNVSFTDYDGVEHTLSEYIDGNGVLLLSFWYPGCGPCRAELPLLQPLYEEYSDQGFEILVIDRDRDREDALEFIEEKGLTYPFVENGEGEAEIVNSLFKIRGYPTSFVIDAEGRILYYHLGYKPDGADIIEEQVREILRLDA